MAAKPKVSTMKRNVAHALLAILGLGCSVRPPWDTQSRLPYPEARDNTGREDR